MSDKDNNNDHLDDFLRKHLERLEATPSDGVWSRLNDSLKSSGVVPQPKTGIVLQKWHLAAALLALVTMYLVQYCHFSHQMDTLKEAVAAQKSTIEGLTTQQQTYLNTIAQQHNQTLAVNENAHHAVVAPILHPTTVNNTLNAPQHSNNIDKMALSNPDLASNINALSPANPIAVRPTISYFDTMRPTKLLFHPVIDTRSKIPRTVWSEQWNVPHLTSVYGGAPKVYHNRKMSLGAHVSTALLATSVTQRESEFGQGGFGHEDVFLQNETIRGNMTVAGITIQQSLSPRWAVTSGLDFTSISTEKMLKPSLRFGDRDQGHHGGPGGPGGPGGHDNEHDFNYLIGTNTGTYLLGVQLSERDSSQTINDDEVVDFDVKTQEHTTMVGIPLGLQYKRAWKHWALFAQGGFRANIVTKRTETLESFECNSNLFEIKDSPKLSPPSEKRAVLTSDAYLTAGLEYRMGRVGLQIAPVFYKPLQTINDTHVKVKSQGLGINMGVQYYFM